MEFTEYERIINELEQAIQEKNGTERSHIEEIAKNKQKIDKINLRNAET